MKRIWVAILFITLSLGLCIFEQTYLYNIKNKLDSDIKTVQDNISNNEKFEKAIEDLNKDYFMFEKTINILCDEKNSQELKMSIIEFNNLSKIEKEKALIQMRALVNAIYDNQKLSLSNIV